MDNVMEEDMQHTDTVLVQMPHNGLIEINVICRLCANPNERIIGIYSEEGISNNLATKMNNYLPVKVSENDSLPLQCCWSCASTVLAWHELVVASVEADRRLRELHNINEKDSSSSDIYSCMDESNSPEEPENKSEHKSAAASLNVFCQEATSPTKSVKLTKKKRITLPYNITQLGEVKREDWIQCDVITDESLQKYIETIQNPFVDTVNTTIHKIIRNETESEPLNKSKSKKNNEDEDPDDKKVFVVSPSIENSLVLTEDIKASELAEEDKHDTSEDYNFACQYCSLLFVKEDEIINHVKVEHPDKDLDFINGNSKELSKKERRKNTKLDHDIVNAAKVVVEGRIYYNCKICGKSLHSPYTYIWHMRIHTGERPYVCDLCGKQFRVSQGLVRHLRETHEGIKNFGCDLCGRMFATRRNVEEHRRIHTNERPYICDLCGKSFKQKASLFVHNRSHTDSFPFRCSYCNQGFRTRPPLLIHVTRHTGEKPYPCDVCGRCFRIKYELKRHKLIHSEEKPFSCSECGLSFRQKRYLRNHNKINHERMAS